MDPSTLTVFALQLFDRNVLIPRFARGAAVNLHADEPLLFQLIVGLGVIDGLQAIEPKPRHYQHGAVLLMKVFPGPAIIKMN